MIDANANLRWIPVELSGELRCVAFRPDGRHLVGGQSSGYIRQWKVDSGEEFTPLPMKSNNDVTAIATSMDGQWIVSGDKQNKVIVWNAVTHQKTIEVSEHTDSVYAVDVSSDSTRVASGSRDRTVRVFDIISGVRVILPLRHTCGVVGVKFSPDGTQIATAMYKESVGIYDARSGNKLFGIPMIQVTCNLGVPVTPLAWSIDGQQLFVATSGKIVTFDTSTFYLSDWFVQNGVNCSIITHGRFIACCAGFSVSFWDYTSRQQIGSFFGQTGQSFSCISVSRDGRYIACGRAQGFQVRDLAELLPQAYSDAPRISRMRLVQVSDTVLESWKRGNPTNTETILSTEIAQYSSPSHHMLAARSLIRSRLRQWETATADAELSVEIKPSPIGQIARSIALIGAGKQEIALDDFDFAFHGGDSNDNMLLSVIKSILIFMCGKHTHAISRLHSLIKASDEDHYALVLVNMYLKQNDHEGAVRTLELAKKPCAFQGFDSLTAISFIFNWDFDSLADVVWDARCKTLYTSGHIKELGETLERMTSPLAQDEKEPAHGRILQELVTCTGEATLLAWAGKSSPCNSCLPSSPAVYSQRPFVHPCLEGGELIERTDELRAIIPHSDAMIIYGRVTRLQPVRFVHFRLHLPCIVFNVTSLKMGEADTYCVETTGLGDVQFTTADSLPLNHPRRLVFADLRIHGLQKPHSAVTSWDDATGSDAGSTIDPVGTAFVDADIVRTPIIEEVPSTSSDMYTAALELIAHLGQPFSALLFLQQPEGVYKRVAADREIVVRGMGNNFLKHIRVEVLEIL